jgi:flagellar hook-associated protein 3 FlgL
MALSNINDILKRAKELTVQAASETNSVNERNAIAEEITELRNQLVQIGNTTYAGSYLFSGYKTDKPLLNADGTYDIGGGTSKLTLDEVIEINVGIGDRVGANTIGQRVFGLYSGAADLDLIPADTLNQQQSMKGSYLDLAEHPITGPVSFILNYGGVDTTINLPDASYNSLTDLTADIASAITGSPTLDTHVSVSIVDNKLVFEADGEFNIKSGTLDVKDIGMTNNQASVSRIESGDSSQLIEVFDRLIDDLTGDDTEGIGSALARIENQADNINALIAEIGVKSNRVELTTNRILDDTLNLRDLLSKNEDADIAEVIMNLKMEEYIYQASLSGGAKIIQPTLVDFIS